MKLLRTLGVLPPSLGLFVLAFAIAAWLVLGEIYAEAQARRLFASLSSSSLYFASAVATSATTVIALMLAMLSITYQSEMEWSVMIYRKMRLTTVFGVVALTVATVQLLFLSAPAEEAASIPDWWFTYLYPAMYAIDALLAVIMTMTAGLLFDTVAKVISALSPSA